MSADRWLWPSHHDEESHVILSVAGHTYHLRAKTPEDVWHARDFFSMSRSMPTANAEDSMPI